MPELPLSPRTRLRVVVALALIGAAFQCLRFLDPDFVIDDCFITFRVARNWVAAGVPTFDVGFPPVESSTTPLWTALAALWIKAFSGASLLAAARLTGALCHLGSLALLLRLTLRLAEDHGGSAIRAALWTAVAFDSWSWLAWHDVSGMETGLFGLLFVASAERFYALYRVPRTATALVAGCLLGLLGACRPEGVFIAMLAGAVAALSAELRPFLLAAALPSAAIIGGVQLWRWLTYHAWVPNTLHAKPPSLADGLSYLLRFAIYGLGILGPVAAAPLVKRSPFARGLVVVLALLALGLVASGGDWMPGFRRLTPLALGILVLAAAGAGLARGRSVAVCMVALVAWVAGNVALAAQGRDAEAYDTVDMAELGTQAKASGLHQVALSDIGSFGWTFGGSIFDLYGLTDRRIASAPGLHGAKALDLDYFRERNPDAVIFRSFGDRLESLDDVKDVVLNEKDLARAVLADSRYRLRARIPYAAGHLFLFVRAGLDLPRQVWGDSIVLEVPSPPQREMK